MGIIKIGWIKWTLFLSVGFLFVGNYIGNYFEANAEVNEATNQPKISVQTLNEQLINDEKFQKKIALMQQNEVEKWKKQHSAQGTQQVTEDPKTVRTTQPPNPVSTTTPTVQENTQPVMEPKTVYLTFDDGPQLFSNEIIALLEQYQFKATFFMLEGNMKKYPDAVKRMVETGQSVGLHGVSHDRKQFYSSVNSVLAELDQTRLTLKEITGIDSFLIRTPFGSKPDMTNEYKQAVFESGYLMWDWNIDSLDWYYKDNRLVTSVIEQIEEISERTEPIVILLHEKKETLEQLPILLDYLKNGNFEAKVIDSTMIPIHF